MRRRGRSKAPSPAMTCCNLFLYSSGNFGSLLGSHPCYNTESDLVDHISNVVCDTHPEFAFSTSVDDLDFWAEEVTERVDDPSNNDEPSECVCTPLELVSNLTVVDTKSVSPWGTSCNDCLLYTSPSPRDLSTSRMPSSA